MNFTQSLLARLSAKHLLKHPFYQAWSDGSLSPETLRLYAGQYSHHVSAFPRYLSATHSQCEDLKTRQMLLENLIDEERGEDNHPELWARFAEGLGEDRCKMALAERLPETKLLVDTFLGLAQSSYEEGLGALFAYEHQIPEIAQFKLDALSKFYGLNDDRSTAFFRVHMKADIYHTQALSSALEALSPAARKKAEVAAQLAADRLWQFLDGVQARAAA